MKLSTLITISFNVLIAFLIISCGQTTLKDEGLDSKTIEEAAGTSSGDSSDDNSSESSSFTVSSVSPADGATDVSRSGATITITFGDDVRLKNTSGSWTTSWTTSMTSEDSCSNSYGSKLVHISRDNFTNCHPNNGSISGKIITLTLNGTLSSSGSYKVKVLKTSLDGSASTQSTSGVQLSSDYSFSFTADD
jgi:hypothetical protein